MRAFLAVVLFAVSAHASDVMTKFETVKVAEGVFAFVPPEPKSGLVNGNSVAIIGEDGVLVVDTGQVPSLTRKMIAEIRSRTDKPVRYVVNTHWHWDHNLANFVYKEAFPNATIVSTAFTRQMLVDTTPKLLDFLRNSGNQMIERTRKRLETATTEADKANAADDLDDFVAGIPEVSKAVFVAPDQTFEQSLTVYLGKREVRIFHLGRANTAGDALVYVPDAKVLIAGDVLVAPTPYATSAYFTEWIDVLKKLNAMEVATIVPGHGPVQRDKTYLTQMTRLLESLWSQVDALAKQGLSAEETAKRIDLEAFRKQFAGDDRRRNRAFQEFFVTPAVKTAWKQARGEKTVEAAF
jgi:cyclase